MGFLSRLHALFRPRPTRNSVCLAEQRAATMTARTAQVLADRRAERVRQKVMFPKASQ